MVSILCLLILPAVVAAGPARAAWTVGAAGTGTVKGTVADSSGARVSSATVTLIDSAGRPLYETRSDRDGVFEFRSVAEGRYELAVQADGLSQTGKLAVDVPSAASGSLEVKLGVAGVSDQMVVTATRTETPVNELGGSASVITSAQLQRMNQSAVAESLRLVPGLAVVQSGGRGTVTSVFAEGGDSDYNKVLIDGIPVNINGGSFDFSSLTPENLDRIEIVRGPESAVFGSDAMTSSIQLFTKRGSSSVPEFEFSGEGGSFDFHRETALLSGAAGRFDYSTSFGFLTTAGRFQNSDFTNRSLSGNFGFRISPDASLRIISRWDDNSLGTPGPTAVLFSDPDERQKH
ncbi:MAG: TonB-dependent receptor plug domain-containing protein, partial [Blastocatellia bacterium]